MLRPNYQIFKIDLSQSGANPAGASGQLDLQATGNYLKFIRAIDAVGNPVLDALINIALARGAGDAIPLGVNSAVYGPTDFWRLTWGLQPGYTAVLIESLSDDASGVKVDAPPAKQLVTQSAGAVLNASQTTVGVTAAVLVAASNTRQSATIRNRGSVSIYVGPSTVTTGSGLAIDPGETFTFSGTTAAIYAIAATAGVPVHVLTEG
jgi:hypothetical protein